MTQAHVNCTAAQPSLLPHRPDERILCTRSALLQDSTMHLDQVEGLLRSFRFQSDLVNLHSVHLSLLLESLRTVLLPVDDCLALLCVYVFLPSLLPFAESILEHGKMWLHHNSIFDKFLHAINESIAITAAHQAVTIIASFSDVLRISLRNRGLVRNGEHAHPAAQDPQSVDRIEGLRAAGDLRNGERSSLSRSHTTGGQWYPIYLVFEYGGL